MSHFRIGGKFCFLPVDTGFVVGAESLLRLDSQSVGSSADLPWWNKEWFWEWSRNGTGGKRWRSLCNAKPRRNRRNAPTFLVLSLLSCIWPLHSHLSRDNLLMTSTHPLVSRPLQTTLPALGLPHPGLISSGDSVLTEAPRYSWCPRRDSVGQMPSSSLHCDPLVVVSTDPCGVSVDSQCRGDCLAHT